MARKAKRGNPVQAEGMPTIVPARRLNAGAYCAVYEALLNVVRDQVDPSSLRNLLPSAEEALAADPARRNALAVDFLVSMLTTMALEPIYFYPGLGNRQEFYAQISKLAVEAGHPFPLERS